MILRRLWSAVRARLCCRREVPLVFGIYQVLAVVMTWPAAAHLSRRLIGRGVDVWSHQWTFAWVRRCIVEGRPLFYTREIFYPQGVSLVYHNIAWLNIAVWLPLQAVIGSHAAYNLLFLVTTALNSLMMYRLAREVTSSRPASFLSGLVFGFWPYVLSYSDSPNMVLVAWVPLALLYLQRALAGCQKRDLVLAGVALFLTGLTRWHLLIMAGPAILMVALRALLAGRRGRLDSGEVGTRFVRLLTIVLIAAALLTPVAAPLVSAQLTRAHPEDLYMDEQAAQQTDLAAYLTPSRFHPLWGNAVSSLYLKFEMNEVHIAFVGYVTLALAALGCVRRWKVARFWLVMAALYVVLAAGSVLRVAGRVYPDVPMPYRLIENMSVIRLLRRPDRFNILLGLPVGILAGLGADVLLRAWAPAGSHAGSHRKPLVMAVLGFAVLFEYCPVPYSTLEPRVPAWYHTLAQEPGRFAILDLPTQPFDADKRYMDYQLTHGKPLVIGKIARVPREAEEFIRSVPFLAYARSYDDPDPATVDLSRQLRQLARANVRYVVLHKEMLSAAQEQAWRAWFALTPYHEDEQLIVYRTDLRFGQDIRLVHAFGDGLGLITSTAVPSATLQGATVSVQAHWGSAAAPGRDLRACLALVEADGNVFQTDCLPVSPTWPPSQWTGREVVRDLYTIQVGPFVRPGVYALTLQLAEEETLSPIGAPYTLGTLSVEALPRVFALPVPAHPLDVRWGEEVRLLGYDIFPAEEETRLTVYWLALQRIPRMLKVFVHVVDAMGGDLVWQVDAVPRDWSYPSTWWEQGEVVSDTYTIPLGSASPGLHQVYIGLVDMETGERIPARSAEGTAYAGDAVPLWVIGR